MESIKKLTFKVPFQSAIHQVHLPQQFFCRERDVMIVLQVVHTVALQVDIEEVHLNHHLKNIQVQYPTHHALLQLHN